MTEKETMLLEFKASLESKSMDELLELEKEIISEAEALDKEASEKTFVLLEDDKKEMKPTTRKKFGQLVANYIGRTEASWQQALVLKVIIDFWRSSDNLIKFPVLDNTLRILGQVKYQGLEDIDNVIYINNLFENIRESFMEFSERLYTTAEKHQSVMAAMELLKKPEPTNK